MNLPPTRLLVCVLVVVVSVCVHGAVCATYPGYRTASVSDTPYGQAARLELLGAGPFGNDVKELLVQTFYYSQDILRIKISDANNARWEVPNVNVLPLPMTKPSKTNYKVTLGDNPFGVNVARASDNTSIFNTLVPNFSSLIFEDQYLEVSTQLPDNYYIYGLGERIHSLRLQPDNTFSIWPRDQGTPLNSNLYGHHPFYLEMRNGRAHGVFLLNSNAQDVVLTRNALTYKTTGGILDFFLFLGTTPNDVITQYQTVVGFPYMPPYWSLGWHQCRWGYNNIDALQTVVNKYAENKIPLDTIWNDIDYMDSYKVWTTDPNNFPLSRFRDFVKTLHNNGQQYMMIVDPGVAIADNYAAYTDLMKSGAYIKNANGSAFVGKVWPGLVSFPDFLNQDAQDYWFQHAKNFHDNGPEFDGMWIDMNEPSNFCDGQCLSDIPPPKMPYVPQGGVRIDKSTVDVYALTKWGPQYDTHSLYGWSEGIASKNALEKLRNKRAVVISRSTFAGSGSHNGHWLGDNGSSYSDLYYSIPGVLNMQLLGVNFVGADICGFAGETNEQLCARWMQLGTLYPFSRNHNVIGSRGQEPYAFGQLLIDVSRESIQRKYALLPYYYDLFFRANQFGNALIWRPLFFEFSNDQNTLSIDTQFLIGPAILVTPVLTEGATTVQGYFPDDMWYSWYDGSVQKPGSATLNAPITFLPIHVRGGYVIPTQEPGQTVHETRNNPFVLVVALSSAGTARGNLYLDDGDEINAYDNKHYTQVTYELTAASDKSSYALTSTVNAAGWDGSKSLFVNNVTFMGVARSPAQVLVNKEQTNNFAYNADKQTLIVSALKLSLDSAFTVVFSYNKMV